MKTIETGKIPKLSNAGEALREMMEGRKFLLKCLAIYLKPNLGLDEQQFSELLEGVDISSGGEEGDRIIITCVKGTTVEKEMSKYSRLSTYYTPYDSPYTIFVVDTAKLDAAFQAQPKLTVTTDTLTENSDTGDQARDDISAVHTKISAVSDQ